MPFRNISLVEVFARNRARDFICIAMYDLNEVFSQVFGKAIKIISFFFCLFVSVSSSIKMVDVS